MDLTEDDQDDQDNQDNQDDQVAEVRRLVDTLQAFQIKRPAYAKGKTVV